MMKKASLLPLLLLGVGGCGGAEPPAKALENKTFYQYDDLRASGSNATERPYPPLDLKSRGYIGVSILGGTVHLSRPENWTIRRASGTPERRFIEYVSPNEYVFAIYERTDIPVDTWKDVMERYEEDAKSSGAELVGGRVPIATWNAQGRAYVMRRKIKGQKAPFTNLTREVLLRSEHRVDLVEIVHQGETLVGISDEMLRVMDTLELL